MYSALPVAMQKTACCIVSNFQRNESSRFCFKVSHRSFRIFFVINLNLKMAFPSKKLLASRTSNERSLCYCLLKNHLTRLHLWRICYVATLHFYIDLYNTTSWFSRYWKKPFRRHQFCGPVCVHRRGWRRFPGSDDIGREITVSMPRKAPVFSINAIIAEKNALDFQIQIDLVIFFLRKAVVFAKRLKLRKKSITKDKIAFLKL